jgi:hypothetical protein
MNASTLVVSNPPHGEVNLEAAAQLLGLDVFAMRLKAKFAAPEILGASGRDEATQLASALRTTGLEVTTLPSAVLAELPWPDPASHMAFDDSSFRATIGGRAVEIAYDTEVVCVFCQPPVTFSQARPIDLGQAIASGHGPTIADAMQERGFIDLYFMEEGAPRRVSVVPQTFGIEAEDVLSEFGRRGKALRLDRRLVGVRPRARSTHREKGAVAPETVGRRGYSFGTLALSDLLGSIAPELREAPQFELGSRMAFALSPLASRGG